MKRLFIKPIDEATSFLWKSDVVAALKKMEPVPTQMEADLMTMLRPHYNPKGHLLLDPDMLHKDATFLRSGLIKLYVIHPVSGRPQILHVWIEGEILVLYKMYRHRLKNTKYYIETIENSELLFPEFCHRLSNADRCAFIGVGESTLGRGNH